MASGLKPFMVGWDLGAALQLAAALGYCPVAVAEMLPEIEPIRVSKFNEGIDQGDG